MIKGPMRATRAAMAARLGEFERLAGVLELELASTQALRLPLEDPVRDAEMWARHVDPRIRAKVMARAARIRAGWEARKWQFE